MRMLHGQLKRLKNQNVIKGKLTFIPHKANVIEQLNCIVIKQQQPPLF